MNSAEFRSIREKLGLGVVEFGRAIGYAGNDNTVSVRVRRFEDGKEISPVIARLVRMFDRFGIPDEFE